MAIEISTFMANTKFTMIVTVAILAVVIIGCVIAYNGAEHDDGSGTFVYTWGTGTSMDYDIDGGYTRTVSGYDVSYSLRGSAVHDEIISSAESQFTFQRDATMKVTHTDPSTGEIQTETQQSTNTVVQDRELKYHDAVPSTIDTKWGTKNVVVMKYVTTDSRGNKIDTTDYRDADTFVRYRIDFSCDSYVSSSDTLKDWHMTYTLTDFKIVENN